MTTPKKARLPRWLIVVLLLRASLPAADTPLPADHQPATFEQRIGRRADQIMLRLDLANPATAADVRDAVLRFYRDLHSAHSERDARLAAAPAGNVHGLGRVVFEADKSAAHIAGGFIGALARRLSESQVDAVKDWMTFDMVALSVAEYDRMFPALDARHRAQLRAWLVESREAAIIAGSAETKLDVFRVNKMRMHAYLAAQDLDVESAVRAEAARKAAAKKPE